jgi:hypothetical protein
MVGTARGVIGLERAAGDWRVTGRTLESAYISALMPIPDERLFTSATPAFASRFGDGFRAVACAIGMGLVQGNTL